MTLSILIAREKWQEFDQAWKDLMAAEGPIDDVLYALRLAGEKKRASRCVNLAKEHVELLEAGGRHEDAARVMGSTIAAGGPATELTGKLLELCETAWGTQKWWPVCRDLCGIPIAGEDAQPLTPSAWRSFDRLLAFNTGTLVYHGGGWGVGEIKEARRAKLELDVTFWDGRKDTFPMNAAVDIFQPLKTEDLKSIHFRDPEGSRKAVKKEPLDAMRTILTLAHGQATTMMIRNTMAQVGIEGSAWSAWWRKARKLAENSEWFEVSGSQQKSIIKLLLAAKDPVAALRRQLTQAGELGPILARVRELFVGESIEEDVKLVGLEILEEMAAKNEEVPIDRVSAWLLLREQRSETPVPLLEVLQDMREAEVPSDPSTAPPLWALFQELTSVRDQERCAELLQEIYPESWLEEAARHLPHAAPGMVRPLVEALKKADRMKDLERHYLGLLARPLRSPSLLVTLSRLFERAGVEMDESAPKPSQRAHALISLATHLFEIKRGNAHLTRVHGRLADLLAGGKEPVLRHLLQNADKGALRSLQTVVARGVDPSIDHLATDIAVEKDHTFFASQVGPFWESETIWATKGGLERRAGELRELREVKIPENQDAIGRAAAFGDLSENSEWEAAIEEQRNLTNRAMDIEEELRLADLIENAALPEGIVCPGTEVRYIESDNGVENTIRVLGPWDDYLGDNVVSYRAPLAAGLLGHKVGHKTTLELPGGKLDIEVLAVAVIPLD